MGDVVNVMIYSFWSQSDFVCYFIPFILVRIVSIYCNSGNHPIPQGGHHRMSSGYAPNTFDILHGDRFVLHEPLARHRLSGTTTPKRPSYLLPLQASSQFQARATNALHPERCAG